METIPENLLAAIKISEAHVAKRELDRARLTIHPVLEHLAATGSDTPARVQRLYARILILEAELEAEQEKKPEQKEGRKT